MALSIPSSASSKHVFQTPLVTLIVEQEKTRFTVHEGVLCKFNYFQACLKDEGFAEGSTKQISFPDETPETIGDIVNYAYWKQLPSIPDFQDYDDPDHPNEGDRRPIIALKRLTKFYIAADRFMMEEVKEDVIMKVTGFEKRNETWIWPLMIVMLNEAGLEDSELKTRLLILLVEWIARQPNNDVFRRLHDQDSLIRQGLTKLPPADFILILMGVNAMMMGGYQKWKNHILGTEPESGDETDDETDEGIYRTRQPRRRAS